MKVLEPAGKVAPVSDVVVGSGELWLPAKELNEVMVEVVRSRDPNEPLFQELNRILTQHAGNFSSIFKIKPPNPVDLDELQKCSTEGRYLKGFRGKQVLTYPLVNEATMLSEMFQINEFLALDLLTLAENETDNYPEWPRGIIAVHMFYEGRLWLIQALATMIQCSPGNQWESNLHPQIIMSFRRTLNSVFREDMMDRLINLLETFSIEKQLEILESNLALGDSRHRRKVKTLLMSIKDAICRTIFCYACQRSLRWAELARVLDYLKLQVSPEERRTTKGDATLIACVLYSIETILSPQEIDRTFHNSLLKYLEDTQDKGFKSMELWDVFKLALHISVQKAVGNEPAADSLSSTPRGRSTPGPQGDPTATQQHIQELLGSDFAEFEFTRNMFEFLRIEIFSHASHYTADQDVIRIFHGYLVDFITHMPMKLKEIKFRSEEIAKTNLICQEQGLNPPNHDIPVYESFLECLGEFYEHDPFELGRYYFFEQSQFLPLAKLVRSSCMESPALFVSSMHFLTGITTGNPKAVFGLLRQGGHNASLDHFFESILKYLQTFGVMGVDAGNAMQHPITQYQDLLMNPLEIRGICAYLRLIETVCERHEPARTFFACQKTDWISTMLQVVKIRKIPREIRASMLETCAAMIGEEPLSPDVVSTLWGIFYAAKLIDPGTGDVKEELEEKETRLEEYQLTLSMLRLLRALIKTRFREMEFVSLEGYFVHPTYDNGAIFPYLNYVTDTVFLKAPYRLFKDGNQRWYMMRLCTDIMSIMLDYLPKLMIQLLCDSPLIRTLLNSLVDCAIVGDLGTDVDDPFPREGVDRCSLSMLTLLWRALQRQPFYMNQRGEIMESQVVLILGIHKLMTSTSLDGGSPEYLFSLIRFIDPVCFSPEHMKICLDILSIILESNTDIDHQIHHALVWQESLASVFRHTLIEILYKRGLPLTEQTESTLLGIQEATLKLLRTSVVHADPNVGLLLLSFDSKKRECVGGRTLLQAVIDNASCIPSSFMTLLTLLSDPRLSQLTLRFLRYSRFFQSYLLESDPIEEMSNEALSYFLKCLAIELKSEEGFGTATELAAVCVGRLHDILNSIELENQSVELPDLDFFDAGLVLQALSQCEYVDRKLRTRLIRVEMLDGMLKDEVTKLEKSTILRLRKTVHSECKDLLDFARNLNENRRREGCKLLVFDGWRQVVEVLALSPQLRSQDFCSALLRILLMKVLGTPNVTDFFLRLAAESTLTLTAVMVNQASKSDTGAILTMIMHSLCRWLATATNMKVRGILYAALLNCVNLLEATGSCSAALAVCQDSFPLILDNLCRDCCQGSGEITRMHALYLMGEIIKCTTFRGLAAATGGVLTSTLFEGDEGASVADMSQVDHPFNRSVASYGSFEATNLDKTGQGRTIGAGMSKASSMTSTAWAMRGKEGKGGGVFDRSNSKNLPSSEIIMNCVYTNGFLSTIVEGFCVVDDMDLMTLLNTEQQDMNSIVAMRAFFVFEAKLNMLSRLAESGLKAVMHLMDLNLIKRLTDMKVFEMQSYRQHGASGEEAGSYRSQRKDEPLQVLFSREGRQSGLSPPMLEEDVQVAVADHQKPPSHFTVSESLHIQVLKLFHVLLDSAPKNLQVLEQIVQFLRVHDSAVSKILGQNQIGARENPRKAPHMLTSLMAKLACNPQRIRSGVSVYLSKTLLKPTLLNVLRTEADRNGSRGDEVRTRLVKHVVLFLHYSSKRSDQEVLATAKSPIHGNYQVLSNRLDLDNLLPNSDENVSVGVISQVVQHAAMNIIDSQVKEKRSGQLVTSFGLSKNYAPTPISSMSASRATGLFFTERLMEDSVIIIEVGLSLIYFHLNSYIRELQKEYQLHKGNTLASYKQSANQCVEDKLVWPVTKACKKIEQPEYIETLLLKIRRLVATKDEESSGRSLKTA